MIVVDASAVVAALVDAGEGGAWAAGVMQRRPLAAPHLMPVEATNVLRRAVLTGSISDGTATQALVDLLSLRVELYPFEPLAARVWELRGNLTAYDAWYVALAEELGTELITLDGRLGSAPGPRCVIRTPTGSYGQGYR